MPSYAQRLMLADAPIGTATTSCCGGAKLKSNEDAAAVLIVMGKEPVAVVDPMAAVKGMLRSPAASELAACRYSNAPVAGIATPLVELVIPVGNVPRVTVPIALKLISEGCTLKENVLLG